MYVCMYVSIYVCMHVCMHACMYVCMHVFMYVCMFVCMYACMDTYIHACIHNIHIYLWQTSTLVPCFNLFRANCPSVCCTSGGKPLTKASLKLSPWSDVTMYACVCLSFYLCICLSASMHGVLCIWVLACIFKSACEAACSIMHRMSHTTGSNPWPQNQHAHQKHGQRPPPYAFVSIWWILTRDSHRYFVLQECRIRQSLGAVSPRAEEWREPPERDSWSPVVRRLTDFCGSLDGAFPRAVSGYM